jgi:hypothetical protein
MAVFWVVAPCSLVNFTNVSEVLAAYHHQGDETLVNFYRLNGATTQKTAIFNNEVASPRRYVRSLIESMPRRMISLVEVGGFWASY